MKMTGNHVAGTLKAYNFSPKGTIEAVLVEHDGKVLQLNCPPEIGEAVRKRVQEGKPVEADYADDPEIKKHHDGGHHPVHLLVRLRSHDGVTIDVEGTDPGQTITVEGVVARLNYTRHGEPNGVVLETGDFIHLKPDGMREAKVKVGDTIKVEGAARPIPGDRNAVEAHVVNGTHLKKKHH